MKIGKLKSTSSKRDVPLNQSAVDAILDLRAEWYFVEDASIIADEHEAIPERYYRILKVAELKQRGAPYSASPPIWLTASNNRMGRSAPFPPGRWPSSLDNPPRRSRSSTM